MNGIWITAMILQSILLKGLVLAGKLCLCTLKWGVKGSWLVLSALFAWIMSKRRTA